MHHLSCTLATTTPRHPLLKNHKSKFVKSGPRRRTDDWTSQSMRRVWRAVWGTVCIRLLQPPSQHTRLTSSHGHAVEAPISKPAPSRAHFILLFWFLASQSFIFLCVCCVVIPTSVWCVPLSAHGLISFGTIARTCVRCGLPACPRDTVVVVVSWYEGVWSV